jgi:sulfur-oxidizing protein SoxY
LGFLELGEVTVMQGLKIVNWRRLKRLCFVLAAFLASSADLGPSLAETAQSAAWEGIKKDVFGNRDITDGKGMIEMEAPVRAEEAALVPITIKMPASFAAGVKSLTLVVDQNPAPVATIFTYGPAAGTGDRMLSLRIRMDQYSNVRAIAETNDGKLYMTTKYVKASGGCSAPANKDLETAMQSMGKIQFKRLAAKDGDALVQEAQLMIKHPNNSGMQMDQLTGLYTPARYINKVEVKSGNDLVFTIHSGISISEDPNFRFSHGIKPGDTVEIKAEDSDGAKWSSQFPADQS